MKILVTGAAGFIGFHLCNRLLSAGHTVLGIDNLNSYYDVSLKRDRLSLLVKNSNFEFLEADVAASSKMENLFREHRFDRVIHLAAQAGVRYSIENPQAYIQTNVVGFANILEGVRHSKVPHLVFASSSSVYGANKNMPYSVHQNVDHPLSLYAATKKSNELMAHTYAHLFKLPMTGLRFFTVYGPWGRPDMALFLFTKAILKGEPISVFNYGKMKRDFTYVDDIIEGIFRIMDHVPQPDLSWSGQKPDPASSLAPYRIYNIGNNQPVDLLDFIQAIEEATGKKAEKIPMPLQLGDVEQTYADISDLEKVTGFKPQTPLQHGIRQFVKWFREYYKV